MESSVHNIRDLNDADRRTLERIIGLQLSETQQVIVNIREIGQPPNTVGSQNEVNVSEVPSWWNIYEGLTDEEVDELDRTIRQRADLTRHFE